MDWDKESEMKMNRSALVAVALMAMTVAAACAPTPAAPTEPPSSAAAQPAATAAFAPMCQPGTSCQVPTAEQNQIECVNKVPYTNVLVEPGTTFEVLDKSGDFTCNDSGTVVDGKMVISCYGKELYSFDLKLTNPACGGANLQTGTGQCADGYGYDGSQQCCAPVGGDTAGSTVVSVELGACPLPQVLTPN
jgi:hypothetical protein